MQAQDREQGSLVLKIILLLLPLGFMIFWLLATPKASWIEYTYARGIYPMIATVLVPLGNLLPVSYSSLGIVLGLCSVIFSLIMVIRKRLSLYRFLYGLFLGGAWLYMLFVLVWGANYHRFSIEMQLDLVIEEIDDQDIKELLAAIGPFILEFDQERDVKAASKSLRHSLKVKVFELTGEEPTLPRIKTLPASTLIRLGSASGIVSPWTLEAHVDRALSELSYLSVGTHELAHIAGYAREADADLLAVLAGLSATDPYARYAVALHVWQSALWQLPVEERKPYLAALPKGVKEDLDAIAQPFRRYLPPKWLQDLQRQTYDRYLKSQGVSGGIIDYSRATTLLVLAHKQGHVLQEEE